MAKCPLCNRKLIIKLRHGAFYAATCECGYTTQHANYVGILNIIDVAREFHRKLNQDNSSHISLKEKLRKLDERDNITFRVRKTK